MEARGYGSSCKNMRLRLPPMQQALCVCVSKTDPVATIPSPYPVTTPHLTLPSTPAHRFILWGLTASLARTKVAHALIWICSSTSSATLCFAKRTMKACLFGVCFSYPEGAQSYWDNKERHHRSNHISLYAISNIILPQRMPPYLWESHPPFEMILVSCSGGERIKTTIRAKAFMWR